MAGGNGKSLIRKNVCSSDDFLLNLSPIQRDLYYQFLQSADCWGFIGKVQIDSCFAMLNIKPKAKQTALDALEGINYIIQFESGVIVIVHWWALNNRDDREEKKNPTIYTKEQALLTIDNSKRYRLISSEIQRKSDGNITNLTENNIKKLTNKPGEKDSVCLSGDSIYSSMSEKDRETLKGLCEEKNCDLSDLITLVDTSIRNRKEQTKILNPFRYILQVADSCNWNPSDSSKSYLPKATGTETKTLSMIQGSLWDNLNEEQRKRVRGQFPDNDINDVIQLVDTYIQNHPEEEWECTEEIEFMRLGKNLT